MPASNQPNRCAKHYTVNAKQHAIKGLNTDAAMIGMGNEKAVALGSASAHDDPLNGLIGGWPFLESAWLEQG
jgi:hypothetical protein